MNDVDDARDIAGFHQMVVCGDFQRTLQLYGQLVGIHVVPIAARAGKPKPKAAATACCPCRCRGGCA